MGVGSVTGVLTAGLLIGLCGCGGQQASAPAADGSGTYVGHTANAVLFLQWTRSGGRVAGTLRETAQEPAGRGLRTGAHLDFTGLITGTSVTLLLPGGATLVGTLAREGFTLTVPAEAAEAVTVAFVAGTAAQYEAARRSLAVAEYTSPCSLWVERRAARIEFSGARAAQRCARLVERLPNEGWQTTPQHPAAKLAVVCDLTEAATGERALVSDARTEAYGASACRALSGEGWR